MTDAIYKWEFIVDERVVEYDVNEDLTISDTVFGLDAPIEGIGHGSTGRRHLFVMAGSAIYYVAILHYVLRAARPVATPAGP